MDAFTVKGALIVFVILLGLSWLQGRGKQVGWFVGILALFALAYMAVYGGQ